MKYPWLLYRGHSRSTEVSQAGQLLQYLSKVCIPLCWYYYQRLWEAALHTTELGVMRRNR